jgi:hypothetical protein
MGGEHRSVDVVYHESRKREIKTRPMYECRSDERLKLKLRNLHVSHTLVVYYESIKRDLKIKPVCECRCDERLQT